MSNTKSSHAAAAAAIRAELKKNGIKAKVRSECFSMGNSVDVRIFGDFCPAAREEIKAFCNQFQYGHFDGMTDCYEHSNTRRDIPQVKFVSVEFEFSPELRKAAAEYVAKIEGIPSYDRDRYEWMVLCGSYGVGSADDFWRQRKPRVRVAA